MLRDLAFQVHELVGKVFMSGEDFSNPNERPDDVDACFNRFDELSTLANIRAP